MCLLKNMYPTMTKANKEIGKMLSTYSEGREINNNLIKYIIKRHPTKNINLTKIEWIKMKKRKPYNKLSLTYKYKNNKEEDSISWILCIRNIYEKYDYKKEKSRDIITAFRIESHVGTKKKYFIDNTNIVDNIHVGKCSHCKERTKNITTDHYQLPFKKIFDEFIKINNIKFCNIDIFENKENEIKLKDRDLACKWLDYHDNNAKYRLLCKSCNSHFSSYGY